MLNQTAGNLNRLHRTPVADVRKALAPAGPGSGRGCWHTGAVESRPLAVIDIDGVVADVRHRLHLVQDKPKRWSEFFAAAADDPPLPEGVALVLELAADHDILWLTGRPERNRRLTTTWLAAQGLPAEPLLMRPDRDFRPARITKRDELRRIRRTREIAVVVDDDPAVVEVLRADGFPVRLADWLPHSSTLRAAQEQDGRT
jgi:hypothetical protein